MRSGLLVILTESGDFSLPMVITMMAGCHLCDQGVYLSEYPWHGISEGVNRSAELLTLLPCFGSRSQRHLVGHCVIWDAGPDRSSMALLTPLYFSCSLCSK